MNDTFKMFGRYALAIGVSFAVGRGWITPEGGSAITDLAIQIAGLLAAFGPAIYAGMKIENKPKE